MGPRADSARDLDRDEKSAAQTSTAALVPTRRPTTPPPFCLGQLRAAIPAHCFHRSALKSLAYVAVDLAIIAAAVTAITAAQPALAGAPWPARAAAWAAYWAVAGVVGTGLWVCAHECGHGAFSSSPLLNDAVGAILHSALLVPYWSWKYSHARHHAHTGDVEGDEVFVPPVSSLPGVGGRATVAGSPFVRALRTVPGRLAGIGMALTLGWPLYLAFNVSGRAYPPKSGGLGLPPNHFDPVSPIFSKRQRADVAASSAFFVCVVAALAGAARMYGVAAVGKYYGVPLLIVNAWLVIITLLQVRFAAKKGRGGVGRSGDPSTLHSPRAPPPPNDKQHSHPALPHYASSKEWDWLRGALATVDRSYGRVLDTAFHHIADTHVLHHLFSAIPHYHAQEASAAIKPVLGEYYASDGRGLLRALWEDWRDCHWVSPDEEGDVALWFRGDRD